MYCNSCGNQLLSDQAACSRCGVPVGVSYAHAVFASRVERNVRLLSVLWLVYSVFEAIGGCALLMVARYIFPRWKVYGTQQEFLHPMLAGIGCFLLIKAAAGFITGIGLLERQSWARPLALGIGIIAMINIPFGTAIGVYTLWVLLSREAELEWRRLAATA
jgi:hypothetical protein